MKTCLWKPLLTISIFRKDLTSIESIVFMINDAINKSLAMKKGGNIFFSNFYTQFMTQPSEGSKVQWESHNIIF